MFGVIGNTYNKVIKNRPYRAGPPLRRSFCAVVAQNNPHNTGLL